MGHDEHFLLRLDRFSDEHVALALTLYREPELVRAVLAQGRISHDAERVVIHLDEKPLGERVIVARGGGFVTCLAENMATGPWPTVPRACLEIVLLRRERSLRQLREVGSRTNKEWQAILLRLQSAGHTLTREEFLSARPIVELLPTQTLPLVVSGWKAFEDACVPLSLLRPGDPASAEVLRKTWDKAWFVLHLTSLLGAASNSFSNVLEVIAASNEHRTATFVTLCAASATMLTAGVARSINTVARMGKALLPVLKRSLGKETSLPAFVTNIGALQALALGGSKYAAEALKALGPAALVEEPAVGTTEGYYRALRRAVVRQVEAIDEFRPSIEANARKLAHRLLQHGTYKEQFATAESIPPELVDPVIAQSRDSAFTQDGVTWTMVLAERWARAEPENLYLPSQYLEAARPKRFDLQWTWDLVLAREKLWSPRGPTVRKTATPGRNDPCACGSGKKYKKCCGA